MKLPEKPPKWKEILEKEPKSILEIIKNRNHFDKVTEFNKKYLYWSELKYRFKEEKLKKYVWAVMKLLRSENYEKIKINSIELKYSLIPKFNKKLHYFDKKLAGNIETQSKTLRLQKKYLISSLMEEAIASSIIEGASTTRKVAKSMLRERRKPKNNSEKMIANNYETMQYILRLKNKKITPEILREIQRKVTQGTLENPEDEGRFRDNDEVYVGDNLKPEIIAHQPPSHKKIPLLVKKFCDFANEETENSTHPIIKGIILHFLIGYIHPFNDGNGRTARSIYYWYMLSQGYWLFEYLSLSKTIVQSRKKYDLAYLYTEYDELDLTYFIKYNINCIEQSLENLMKYIERKQTEQKEMKKIIQNFPELNIRQGLILEEFIKEPDKIFTIKEIAETFNTVYETARTDLMKLADKRFILKKQSGKIHVFMFNENNNPLHTKTY